MKNHHTLPQVEDSYPLSGRPSPLRLISNPSHRSSIDPRLRTRRRRASDQERDLYEDLLRRELSGGEAILYPHIIREDNLILLSGTSEDSIALDDPMEFTSFIDGFRARLLNPDAELKHEGQDPKDYLHDACLVHQFQSVKAQREAGFAGELAHQARFHIAEMGLVVFAETLTGPSRIVVRRIFPRDLKHFGNGPGRERLESQMEPPVEQGAWLL